MHDLSFFILKKSNACKNLSFDFYNEKYDSFL